MKVGNQSVNSNNAMTGAEEVKTNKSSKGYFGDDYFVIKVPGQDEVVRFGVLYSTHMPKEKIHEIMTAVHEGKLELGVQITERLNKESDLYKFLENIDNKLGLKK